MNKQELDQWQKYNAEVEEILRNLALHYAKTFNINYKDSHHNFVDIIVDVADLTVTFEEDFRCETEIVGGFDIEPHELLCPAAVINKWRLKANKGRIHG